MRTLSTYEIVKLTNQFLESTKIGDSRMELNDGTVVEFFRSTIYEDVYIYLYVNSIEIDFVEITEGISMQGVAYLIEQIILNK